MRCVGGDVERNDVRSPPEKNSGAWSAWDVRVSGFRGLGLRGLGA